MEKRLNAEQQRLVADNHAVIYKILGRLGLPIDEFYGCCAIALCNAALMWQDDGRATFETYATRCIRHAISSEFRRRGALKRKEPPRIPYPQLKNYGSRACDPDFWAELGLFDEEDTIFCDFLPKIE